ncbi:MAG: hypothetical protein AB7L92_08525 [Alphaproteobacteria bacterium]
MKKIILISAIIMAPLIAASPALADADCGCGIPVIKDSRTGPDEFGVSSSTTVQLIEACPKTEPGTPDACMIKNFCTIRETTIVRINGRQHSNSVNEYTKNCKRRAKQSTPATGRQTINRDAVTQSIYSFESMMLGGGF